MTADCSVLYSIYHGIDFTFEGTCIDSTCSQRKWWIHTYMYCCTTHYMNVHMYVVPLPSFKRINHVFSLLNVLLKSRTDTVRTRTTDSTRHHKGRRRWTLGFKIRHVDLIHTQTFVAFIKRGFVLHWNVGTVFDVDSKMRLSKNQRFRPSNHIDWFVLERHVARVVERRFSFHKWIAQTFRNFTLDPTTQRDHVAIAGAFHGGLCKIHNPSCCCCWFIEIIR